QVRLMLLQRGRRVLERRVERSQFVGGGGERHEGHTAGEAPRICRQIAHAPGDAGGEEERGHEAAEKPHADATDRERGSLASRRTRLRGVPYEECVVRRLYLGE